MYWTVTSLLAVEDVKVREIVVGLPPIQLRFAAGEAPGVVLFAPVVNVVVNSGIAWLDLISFTVCTINTRRNQAQPKWSPSMVDRKTTSVDELYSRGRSFPHGQNRDAGARRATPYEPSMKSHEVQRPQSPEDQHDVGYDNRTSGWVRGARGEPTGNNETAEGKPSFDKGQSYRRSDKGNDWNSGSDPAIIRKPERNVP